MGDQFCEVCGADLLVHRTPVGGPAGPVADRVCGGCGSTDIGSDAFCEECGRAQPAGRDRMEFDLGLVAGVGDRGKHRARNEDSMAFAWVGSADELLGVVAVVCDGVASTQRSDQASQAAADATLEVLVRAVRNPEDPGSALTKAVDAAMARVSELATGEPPGSAPSCTLVAAVVTAGTVTVGWVGDSRAYWLAESGSRRLTVDDTVAAQLVAAGMDEAEAAGVFNAHALSSWIGADAGDVVPHVETIRPDGPGLVLLCSDGLWNYLPEPADLNARLPESTEPLAVATELTAAALDRGGHDNITVVVIPYPLRSPGR